MGTCTATTYAVGETCRLARRLSIAGGGVLGLLLLGSGTAQARFFDACAAPGDQEIHVVQDTTVRFENITLFANDTQEYCTVIVDDGVTLRLDRVRVGVTQEKRLNFSGGPTSRLI